MKTWVRRIQFLAVATALSPAFAQVTPAGTTVNSKLQIFLYIITGVGAMLFTGALTMAGYKFAYVEGTKMADLKGILIGGVLFASAAGIAYSFTS
jgi:hypothetical protein